MCYNLNYFKQNTLNQKPSNVLCTSFWGGAVSFELRYQFLKFAMSSVSSFLPWLWAQLSVSYLDCELSYQFPTLAVSSTISFPLWLWAQLSVSYLDCELSYQFPTLAVSSTISFPLWLWAQLSVSYLDCELSYQFPTLTVSSAISFLHWLWALLSVSYLDCELSYQFPTLAVSSAISLVFSVFFFSYKSILSWDSNNFSSVDLSMSGRGSSSCRRWCRRTLTCKDSIKDVKFCFIINIRFFKTMGMTYNFSLANLHKNTTTQSWFNRKLNIRLEMKNTYRINHETQCNSVKKKILKRFCLTN